MIDAKLVDKKLMRMETFLRELETAKGPSHYEAFKTDIVFKRFVERNIELAIEQMIDVCRHLVSGLDLDEPESYAACFETLARADVVPADTVDTFKSMARHGNLLIHGYDGVDDAITFGIFKKRLSDFRLFARSIRGYLMSTPQGS